MKKLFTLLAFIAALGIFNTKAQTVVTLTTGQTWTVPAGVTSATFYLWGGGGGGGGGYTGCAQDGNGTGGGGGACASAVVAVTAGQVYTFTGGAGGTAGAYNSNGGAGGTTTFSGPAGTWTAGGGGGGIGINSSCLSHAGGAGSAVGTGPGVSVRSGGSGGGWNSGTPNFTGQGGGGGGSTGAGGTAATGACTVGAAGTGTYPGGAGALTGGCNTIGGGTAGSVGNVPGGGGSGSRSYTTAVAGGAGGAGRVIVVYTVVLPAPTVTGFVATSACQGSSVVITGTNYSGVTNVTFGGTAASSWVVNSATQITAVVGAGSSGSVAVTTASGTGSLAGFTYIAATAPVISGCPANQTIAGTCAGAVASWTAPTASDACGGSVAAGSQTFNASGSFTVPAGVTSVTTYLWGGGGGGGGGYTGCAQDGSGAGGGGGACASATIAVTSGNVYTITIGAAGAAGLYNSAGGAGGTTTFTGAAGTWTAGGGAGGAGNASTCGTELGGAGSNVGTGIGVSVRSGGNGSNAVDGAGNISGSGGGGGGSTGNGVTPPNSCSGSGGAGGSGTYPGGNGGYHPNCGINVTNASGVAGTQPGGGGSGGMDYTSGTDNGGAGGAGRVIITWPAVTFPTISQTAGLASGSTFPIGTSTVTYTAQGQSGLTSTCSFTITVNAPTATPTSSAASGIGCTGFTANWVAVAGATGYFLDVATDAAFGSMVAGYNNLSVGNVITYPVSGLTAATNYWYRVRATGNCTLSNNSASQTLTTISSTGTPTAVAASSVTCNSLSANWNVVAGATGYFLDVCTNAGMTVFVAGFNNLSVGNVLTYSVGGLSQGTNYYYQVRAGSACPVSANSNVVAQTTFTPAAITLNPVNTTGCPSSNVTFTMSASSAVSFQWRKSGVNIANGATGNGSTYSGVNTTSLTINGAVVADNASAANGFDCVVTGACGNATTTRASLTIGDAVPPTIVGMPANITQGGTCSGAVVSFTAPTPADNCAGSVVSSGSQTISANGTFTVPVGVTSLNIYLWGGGGGGGGGPSTLGLWNNGGGGGGGACASATIAVGGGQVYTATIGVGGTGTVNAGNTGGTTTFTGPAGTWTAGGGGGGAAGNGGAAAGGAGSAVGTGTGVSVRTGGTGSTGQSASGVTGTGGGGGGSTGNGTSPASACAVTGTGGTGTYPGGNGGYDASCGTTVTVAGTNGAVPGGGGGGDEGWTGPVSGGNGGNGQIIITWNTTINYPIITQTAGFASGSTFPVGTTTNTYTATDASGNTSTGSFTVTVTAATPGTPTAISGSTTPCPGISQTYSTTSSNATSYSWTIPAGWTFSGSSTGASVTVIPNSSAGTITVAGVNACGNSPNTTLGVNAIDNTAPVISGTPANIAQNATAGLCGKIINYTAPTSTDNCSGVVNVSTVTTITANGTFTIPAGVTSITAYLWGAGGGGGGGYTGCAQDGSGAGGGGGACASATFAVVAGNVYTVTIGAGGASGPYNSAGGTGGTTTFTGAAGTWTAGGGAGGAGNASTCGTELGGAGSNVGTGAGVSVRSGGNGSNAVDGAGNISGSGGGGGGSTGNGGTPPNTCSGSGGAGGTGTYTGGNGAYHPSCGINITNSPGVAGAAPGGGGSGGIDYTSGTAIGGAGGAGRVVLVYNLGTTYPIVTQTSGLASGSTFPVGTTTNTFRATDGAGNTSTSSFTVTISDVEPPVITCPANQTLAAGAGCVATAVYTLPTATDNCSTASTQTFNYSGSSNVAWVVPSGVTSITVDVIAGKGGTSYVGTCGPYSSTGGGGGRIQGTIAVTSGQTLYINVGGAGGNAGTGTGSAFAGTAGFNGGGIGGAYATLALNGGGGGGGSDIRLGGTALANIIFVAGGGGGGGDGWCGPNYDLGGNGGGLIGQTGMGDNNVQPTGGGGGGTQSAGGAAGSYPGYCANAGSLALGGAGCSANSLGGGGGGGYYGGGSGDAGGGGGGSSYAVPSATAVVHTQGYNLTGNGQVVINYVVQATITQIAGLASGSSFPAGVTTNVFKATDPNGNTATCSFTITVTGSPTISGVAATPVCSSGGNSTITLSGLLVSTTFTVHYNIAGGATQTVSVTSNVSGVGTFTVPLTAINSGQVLTIMDMTNTTTSCSTTFSSNNTVVLVITPGPTLTAVSATPICGNGTVTITLNGLTASSAFTVHYNINGGATQTANPVNSNGGGTGTFTFAGTTAQNGLVLTVMDMTNNASSCSSTFSSNNTATLEIDPTSVGGITAVTGNTEICEGDITSFILAGYTGTTFQWQDSHDGVSWANVTGGTGATTNAYTTAPLLQGGNALSRNYFRCLVSSGVCTSSPSSTRQITVDPPIVNNITADQTVCYNTAPSAIGNSVPTGGNGTYIISWEQSTVSNVGPWTVIGGANAQNYSPSALTQTTWYHRKVVSICTSFSNPVQITVTPLPTIGTASQASTVCNNTSATINLTGMLANVTVNVNFDINGTAQTPASVAANGSGNGSFSVNVNTGDVIHITGVTITSGTAPYCTKAVAFTINITTNPLPTLTGVSAASNCGTANATITMNGLQINSFFDVFFDIQGTNYSALGVASNGAGTGTFTVPSANYTNGNTLTIHSMTNTATTCSQTFSSNNTAVLVASPAITVAATPQQCMPVSGTFEFISVLATGGTPAYSWNVTNLVSPQGTNPAVYQLAQGTSGSFTVTDVNNCSAVSAPVAAAAHQPIDVIYSSSVGTAVANCSEVGLNQWVTYYDPATGKAIFAINDYLQNIGTVTGQVKVVASSQSVPNFSGNITGNCAQYPEFYMRRNFQIQSTHIGNFTSPVGVRLFFPDADLNDLETWSVNTNPPYGTQSWACALNDDVHTLGDVCVTQYEGLNEDLNYNNNDPAPPYGNGSYTFWSNNAPHVLTRRVPGNDATYGFAAVYGGPNTVNYLEFAVLHFSEFDLHGSAQGQPLPVELVFFHADAINNSYIALSWLTATEINNHGFEIERSTDGTNWTNIGWVDGHGTTTQQQNYSFTDNNVTADVVYYYRLKQIDFDNQFQYSNVETAELLGSVSFAIQDFVPNPAANQTNLMITSGAEISITVEFYNMLGQKVMASNHTLNKGGNIIPFDISKLASGTYSAIVTSQNGIYTKKVVITR